MTAPWEAWADATHDAPLPAADHAARRRRLQEALGRLAPPGRTAALLVTGPSNVRWATGFTGSAGALLLTPDGATLLTDDRYLGRAALESPDLAVATSRAYGATAIELAVAAGVDRLAFEGDHLSHRLGVGLQADAAEADLADVIAVHGLVEEERVSKDDAELARIARACAWTDAVLDHVLAAGLVGRTEGDVAAAVEDAIRARQAEVGFATIVATGPNGAIPHHAPTNRVIARGDLVTIDCGARVDGYHADTTRTVAAGTRPGADLVAVFDLVAEAQHRGVEAAVEGAGAADVDAACRDHITAAGHGDAFVHGTGHGVGLDIHEAPAVARTAAATLRPRTVLTVEPGVYLPGRGGVRIEDTVVVTAGASARRLTTAPGTLLVV